MRARLADVLFPMPASLALLPERLAHEDLQARFTVAGCLVDFQLGNIQHFAERHQMSLGMDEARGCAGQRYFRVEALSDGLGLAFFLQRGQDLLAERQERSEE